MTPKPTDTPTASQLGLLRGLARGDELLDMDLHGKLRFRGGGEGVSWATVLACSQRVWLAWADIGQHHKRRLVVSITDLGREAIHRAEQP